MTPHCRSIPVRRVRPALSVMRALRSCRLWCWGVVAARGAVRGAAPGPAGRCGAMAQPRAAMVSAVSTASGQPASRSARVRPLRQRGPGLSSTARCHRPGAGQHGAVRRDDWRSPRWVEAYTMGAVRRDRLDLGPWPPAGWTRRTGPSTSKRGVVGLHREQGLAPAVTSDRHQAVEADLVADHVAQPDRALAEHHRTVAGGEVDRLQVDQ